MLLLLLMMMRWRRRDLTVERQTKPSRRTSHSTIHRWKFLFYVMLRRQIMLRITKAIYWTDLLLVVTVYLGMQRWR